MTPAGYVDAIGKLMLADERARLPDPDAAESDARFAELASALIGLHALASRCPAEAPAIAAQVARSFLQDCSLLTIH